MTDEVQRQPLRAPPSGLAPASEDIATLIQQDKDDVRQRGAIAFIEGMVEDENSIPGMEPEETKGPMAERVLSDLGGGLMESGTQVIGGVRDAVAGALSGVADFDNWANSKVGGLEAIRQSMHATVEFGPLDPETGRPTSVTQVPVGPASASVPDVRGPKTITGGLVRGVSQFLTGFAVGKKALGTLGGGSKLATGGRLVAASSISDFAAFDGHEERLSDLIQSFPDLQNPVTEYLASDMEDSELEGRLKNVAEGALSDVLLTGLVAGLRGMRLARKVRQGGETYAEAQRRIARDPAVARQVGPDLTDLRPPEDMPLLMRSSDVSTLGKDIEDYLGGVGARSGGKALADDVPAEEAARALALSEGGTSKALAQVDSAAVRDQAAEILRNYEVAVTRKNSRNQGDVAGARSVDQEITGAAAAFRDIEAKFPPAEEIRALGEEASARLSDTVFGNHLLARIEKGESAADVIASAEFGRFAEFHLEGGADNAFGRGPNSAPDNPAASLTVSRVETGQGDVFVNWSRIDTAEDVKSVIQQMADAGKGEIDAAKRGVRSNEQTALSANQENAWAVLAERRTGEALNAEKSLALRRLWASSGEKLTDAAKVVTDAPTAANTFLFRRALALHGTIQREVLAVRSETARALQQWAIPAGSPEMMARQIEDTVSMFGSEGVAGDLARRITAMANEGNLASIDHLSRKSALAATHDMVFEYWVNALLSGPKTHMVNAVSNTSTVLLAQMERMTAAGIGTFRGTVDGVDTAEAGAMLHGAIASLPDAWRNLKKSLVTGETGFGLQKLETPRVRTWSTETLTNTRNETFNRAMNLPLIAHGINALGAVITSPGRALGASDEFFKTVSYRMEVHAQAARKAHHELRDGVIAQGDVKRRLVELADDPSDEVSLAAREFAAYNTFTNDAGGFARTVGQFRSKFPIMRFIVPFVNTPANILRFMAERSPAAPMLGDVRADFRAGGRRADMAAARMGLGSFAMLTGFDAAMNGQITGSGPTNSKARAALMRTGWKPYSVKIGDRYFAYNRIDPIGGLLGIAGNLSEVALNSEEDHGAELDEAIIGAIGAVGKQMLDRTYLRGVSDLFTALAEPERRASTYFERLGASFVPAIVREAEAIEDPVLRRATNLVERLKERIPGLSSDLPPRHDLWGREISFQSGLGKAFDAVSPIYSSVENPEPIDLEFQKVGYFPGLPTTSVTISYEKFSLRNEPVAYERYVVLQGATPASEFPVTLNSRGNPTVVSRRMQVYGDRTLLQTMNAIVTGNHEFSAEYAEHDGPGRKRLLVRTIADYREKARARLITEFPDLFQSGSGRR